MEIPDGFSPSPCKSSVYLLPTSSRGRHLRGDSVTRAHGSRSRISSEQKQLLPEEKPSAAGTLQACERGGERGRGPLRNGGGRAAPNYNIMASTFCFHFKRLQND